MSFYDIMLDFILMDAFDDLENPPSSVIAVIQNRWLSNSFKETVSSFLLAYMRYIYITCTCISISNMLCFLFTHVEFGSNQLIFLKIGSVDSCVVGIKGQKTSAEGRRDDIKMLKEIWLEQYLLCLLGMSDIVCGIQFSDGFISKFYSISEHTSPVLAWGFMGPESELKGLCMFFKVSKS